MKISYTILAKNKSIESPYMYLKIANVQQNEIEEIIELITRSEATQIVIDINRDKQWDTADVEGVSDEF